MNREKNVSKWRPVITAIDNTQSQYKTELACLYAEHHNQVDSITSGISDINASNLLPTSLKVFLKLNIDDVYVDFIEKDFDSYSVSIDVDKEIINIVNKSHMMKLENELIDLLVDEINKQLKTVRKIQINRLCVNITLSENKITLISNIKYIK
jgi:hypothetical protein